MIIKLKIEDKLAIDLVDTYDLNKGRYATIQDFIISFIEDGLYVED